MKKIIKSRILLVILTTIIVSSITVYAVNTYSASQIEYNKNGKATVEAALDDLYENRKLGIPVLAGHGSNSYSSSTTTETKITGTLDDNDILSVSNNTFTVKKAGYYLIECAVGGDIGSESVSSYSGHIKLFINGTQINQRGQSYDRFYVLNDIINLSVGDTVYATYSGNGGSYQKKSLYNIFYIS